MFCINYYFQPFRKINDSLHLITKYIEASIEFIADLLNEAGPERTMRILCPFQFDLCIACGKPKSKENKGTFKEDSDDEDDDDKKEDQFCDIIGNIKEKLEKNKLKYKFKEMDTKNDDFDAKQLQRIFTSLYNEFKGKYDKKERYYLHRKRMIGFVDRRMSRKVDEKEKKYFVHTNDGDKDQIYLYDAPSVCRNIPNDAVSEWFMDSSKICLLPDMEFGDGSKAIASFNPNTKRLNINIKDKMTASNIGSSTHCQSSLLTMSFHVKSMDEIKCYLYWNGQITRFWPDNIRTVFPEIFNMDYEGNRDFVAFERDLDLRINKMNKTIKDLPFKGFRQSYI